MKAQLSYSQLNSRKKPHGIESRGKGSKNYAKIKKAKTSQKLKLWKGMNPLEIIFWRNSQNMDAGNEGLRCFWQPGVITHFIPVKGPRQTLTLNKTKIKLSMEAKNHSVLKRICLMTPLRCRIFTQWGDREHHSLAEDMTFTCGSLPGSCLVK